MNCRTIPPCQKIDRKAEWDKQRIYMNCHKIPFPHLKEFKFLKSEGCTVKYLIQLIFKAQNGYRYLLDRQTKCTFPRFKNYLVYVLILIWLPQLFIIHIVWLFDVALCRRQAVTNSANTFYATKRLIGRRYFSVLMDLIWNAIRRFLCFCFDFQLKNVLI